jgi:membrane-associated phospholipid phosphatase
MMKERITLLNRKKINALVLLCAFLWIFFLSSSQKLLWAETQSPPKDRFNREFIFKAGKDFKEVVTSPKNWVSNDLWRLSAVLGTGVLFYAFDHDIQKWVQERRTSSSNDFMRFVSNFGSGFYLAGFMAGLYAAGEIANENSLRKTALLSFESWFASSIFVVGLKVIVGRARPRTGESKHSFYPFSTRTAHNSFPSGHSASAWAVATTVADQSENKVIDVLAYSLATLASLSRVHSNDHWASDVLVGSVFGYFVAKKICVLNRKSRTDKLSFSFQFSKQRQALTLSFAF